MLRNYQKCVKLTKKIFPPETTLIACDQVAGEIRNNLVAPAHRAKTFLVQLLLFLLLLRKLLKFQEESFW